MYAPPNAPPLLSVPRRRCLKVGLDRRNLCYIYTRDKTEWVRKCLSNVDFNTKGLVSIQNQTAKFAITADYLAMALVYAQNRLFLCALSVHRISAERQIPFVSSNYSYSSEHSSCSDNSFSAV